MIYDKKLSILDLPMNKNLLKNIHKTKWNWHQELWFSISAYFDNIKYGIRDVYTGIKNIIVYAPIIYKTREWDYEYLLDLIKFKLERMAKDIEDGKTILNYSECNTEINKTIKCINNFQNSTEVYELENQDELMTIVNEKNENKAEELTREFYLNTYKFEEDSWNKIWDNIKLFGRGWWS